MEPHAADPILVAFNAREGDRGPVEFGIAAARVTGAPLVIQWVCREAEEADREQVHQLRRDLEGRGLEADVREHRGWSVGVELTETAHRLGARMVVLGTTRRGAAQAALLGTTAERVIQEAACPVAVVPRDHRHPADGIGVIGVGFAPTSEGRFALAWAAQLAARGAVRLRAIHVGSSEPALRVAAAELAPDAEIEILDGDPVASLLTAAGAVDLLVLGSRTRGSRRAVILGSVSRTVAERAPCPVLILPRGVEAAAGELLTHVASEGASS